MFHVEPDHNINEEARAWLLEGLQAFGLELRPNEVEKLLAYFARLLAKNEHLNLISAKQDLKTRVAVHLLDSLSPLLEKGLDLQLSALDFGSGGGLPAVPLSIARPGWSYTLTEATGKKVKFLTEVKDGLSLENISLVNRYLTPDNREAEYFDLITVRAVGGLDKLAAVAGPRLKSGGRFIAFKGPQAEAELAAAEKALGKQRLRLVKRLDFKLPLIEADRTLLFFSKD